MTWIRSPSWDGFWILSGIPFGAVFLASIKWGGLGPPLIILWMILLFQTGHLLAPTALAWSHDGFRRIILSRPIKYLVAPVAIVTEATIIAYVNSFYLHNIRFNPNTLGLSAGPTTLDQFKNPFMAMVAIYTVWNAYHFGMQAFGVMSIYRHKAGTYDRHQRAIDRIYCCFVVWTTMVIPFIPLLVRAMHDMTGLPKQVFPFLDNVRAAYAAAALAVIVLMMTREWSRRCLPRILYILTDGLGMVMSWWAGLWGFAIIALNHWLVAIGLATLVQANRRGGSPILYASILMAIGTIVFCALFIDLRQLIISGPSPEALHFTVLAAGFRIGLGFVHFLYDGWVYKFSDPGVRATIGRDIFRLHRAETISR